MSNLLRPHGMPPRAHREPNPGFTPPHSLQDPMPGRLGSFINTPKGMRRTFPDELAKACGVPSAWGEATRFTGNLLNSLIGIHIWEALRRCLAPLFVTDTGPHEPPSVAPPPCPEAAATDSIFRSTDGVFKWVQPDISEGSPWHLDRVYKLVDACKTLPDWTEQFLEGLEALKRHRANYGPDGIQYLQILWWDWPCERWSELRNGCEMNFLVEPRSNLDKPDPVLDETQSGVAN
jgi:hypothetical protein